MFYALTRAIIQIDEKNDKGSGENLRVTVARRIIRTMQPNSFEPKGPAIRHNRMVRIALIAGALVLVAGIGIAIALATKKPSANNDTTTTDTILYGALANAAKQQRIRVAMYRETFATKADADARKNVGSVASSVSELDTDKGYRSVFAYNLLQEDGSFSVGRCMDGTTYNGYYQSPAKNTARAKTLQEAADRLKLMPDGNLYKVTQPLTFISCPHLGLLPASPPVAVARLSDGIFPVTFSDSQAQKWQQKITEAKLFTVKDEGLVDRNGAKLRKISLSPHDDSTSARLYDIFYEAGEVAKVKSEQPKAEVDYEFQSLNPNNSGGAGGYYLIDEQKNLPVYSELYGTNPDKTANESPAADRNIARTKQTYIYPTQLTLTLDSPLELTD
jgi:hypothetical protein